MSSDSDRVYGKTKLWAACLALPQLLALVTSILRVHYRYRRGLWWWDDTLALIVLLLALPFFGTTLILLNPMHTTPKQAVILGLCHLQLNSAINWLSRMSRALSIARILPPTNPIYRAVIGTTYFFLILWGITMSWVFGWCFKEPSWQRQPPYCCPLKPHTVVLPLTTSATADAMLVFIPLRLFWNVNLPSVTRRIILIGFTIGGLAMPISFSLGRLATPFYFQYVAANTTAICYIIGCNALVVITHFYQLWHRRNPAMLTGLSVLSTKPGSGSSLTSVERSNDSEAYSDLSSVRHFQTGSAAMTDIDSHLSQLTTNLYLESASEGSSMSSSQDRQK